MKKILKRTILLTLLSFLLVSNVLAQSAGNVVEEIGDYQEEAPAENFTSEIPFEGYITSFNQFEMEPQITIRITSGALSGETMSNEYINYDEFHKIASPKIGDLMAGVIGDSNLNIKVKGSLKIGICYGYDNMVGENYRSFCKKFVRIELD